MLKKKSVHRGSTFSRFVLTLVDRVMGIFNGSEVHKNVLGLWATIAVILGFGFTLPTYVHIYNYGSSEALYWLLWNGLFDGVLASLIWFLPVFAIVLMYACFTRFYYRDTHRAFLTNTFFTKVTIASIIAFLFTLIIYLDSSNIISREAILKAPYCPDKVVGEVCFMSFVMLKFLLNVFMLVFAAILFVMLALYGFYKGVAPTLDLSSKNLSSKKK